MRKGNPANVDEKRDGKPNSIDTVTEGREQYFMDIDRMVNEGLGGGQVTLHNGLIGETAVDTMSGNEAYKEEKESLEK